PTENCATCPSLTVTLAGCAEITGTSAALPDTHSDQPGVLSMMPPADSPDENTRYACVGTPGTPVVVHVPHEPGNAHDAKFARATVSASFCVGRRMPIAAQYCFATDCVNCAP